MEQKNKSKNRSMSSEAVSQLIRRWKDGSFGEIIDDWKWIFGYSMRYKWSIAGYIILGILSTTLGLVSSVASKYLIDIITGYQMEKVGILFAVMVGGSVSSLLLQSLISRISTSLTININNDIQADVFDKIVDADWMAMNGYSNGDILNRFNGDVNTVSGNAVSWLPTVVIAAYNFIATLLVILYYDVFMALIAVGSAPVLLLISRTVIKKQRNYNKKVREMTSHMMAFEVEAFQNFDTIKSFGVEAHYSKKMRWWQKRYRDICLKYNIFTIQTNALMKIMGTVIQCLAFGYCLFRLWTNDITYGTMTMFLQQRSSLSSAFNNMVSLVPSFLNSSVSAHRIRELLNLPKEVHIAKSSEFDVYVAEGFEIRMSDVNFAYKEEQKVITDSAFKACPGEIVALVGPSGEGKTTMIRLILGLVRPEKGKACLRAGNTCEVELNADTRHLFAYVPQGNTIFSGTIAENMRIVKEDATDKEIIDALKIACAWEFVEKMPDTINGSVGERGRGLSEGQAQRIAIARAILRDAPILLLDEATSALDTESEKHIQTSLETLMKGRTTFVVAHRLSTIEGADRIVVMREGAIVEIGNHHELMEKKGVYEHLYTIQFKNHSESIN
ncbi:MAG: ABC transporter ATP-binding protein [Ruminococcus sp.]|nr:ABC transporter ATP-binding protein [Ruminococcus sp.]